MMDFDPRTLELEKLDECPICGGSQIPVVITENWKGIKIQYCLCESCGMVFLNPRMTDEQTRRYYRGTYRDITSQGSREKDVRIEQLRARKQTALLKPYLSNIKTCLEIGCSTGTLMEALEQEGITCTGVEPELRYYEESPLRSKIHADIDQVDLRAYDLIISSHVIEHLNWPVEYYSRLAHELSHAQTLFVIETPNFAEYVVLRMHHPFAFTEKTLDHAMSRIGLQPVEHFYHGLGGIPQRYLMGVYRKEAA